MNSSPTADAVTPCPTCASAMTHVAITPHPVMPRMQRHTFVCYSCNQTRTYMLPMAAQGGDRLAQSA
jgi:hypothetical protein